LLFFSVEDVLLVFVVVVVAAAAVKDGGDMILSLTSELVGVTSSYAFTAVTFPPFVPALLVVLFASFAVDDFRNEVVALTALVSIGWRAARCSDSFLVGFGEDPFDAAAAAAAADRRFLSLPKPTPLSTPTLPPPDICWV
jgi:hypothetical protein